MNNIEAVQKVRAQETGENIHLSDKMNFDYPSPEFWEYFSKCVWEKETFCKNSDFIKLPVSDVEIFDAIVKMCEKEFDDRFEQREISRGMTVKDVDGFLDPPSDFLPKKSDLCFLGYGERVRKEFPGKEFSLAVDVAQIPLELKSWVYGFLSEVYRNTGRIAYGSSFGCFFGDYSSTFLGVHDHVDIDVCGSAFYFPLIGKKEIRIWKPDYVRNNDELIDSMEYSSHLNDSTLLSAEAGGMFYWPSDRFHVGSSSCEDVAIVLELKVKTDLTLSFCDYVEFEINDRLFFDWSKTKRLMLRLASYLLFNSHYYLAMHSEKIRNNRVMDLPFNPDDIQSCAEMIPDELVKISRFFSVILNAEELEWLLASYWLSILSTFGLNVGVSLDKYQSIDFFVGLRIKRVENIPILWRKINDDIVLLVVNRQLYTLSVDFMPIVEKYFLTNGADLVFSLETIEAMFKIIKLNAGDLDDFKAFLADLINFFGVTGAYTTIDAT